MTSMKTIEELRTHFNRAGRINYITNEAADYQFVKRTDGLMFQYSNGKYKFYKTFIGFLRACLWRIKRG